MKMRVSDPTNPWGYCGCGHLWMAHDVDEYRGDGSETCCTWECDQNGCPGREALLRGPGGGPITNVGLL